MDLFLDFVLVFLELLLYVWLIGVRLIDVRSLK